MLYSCKNRASTADTETLVVKVNDAEYEKIRNDLMDDAVPVIEVRINAVEEVATEPFSWAEVEVQPQFPGGNDKILPYIEQNLRYPSPEKENKTEGTVYVQFVIERSGAVSQIKVLRNTAESKNFENEAIRLLKGMPHWQPGVRQGQVVEVINSLPIRFKL